MGLGDAAATIKKACEGLVQANPRRYYVNTYAIDHWNFVAARPRGGRLVLSVTDDIDTWAGRLCEYAASLGIDGPGETAGGVLASLVAHERNGSTMETKTTIDTHEGSL